VTIGTDRVRHSFNPSGNETVDDIKGATAALIDLCDGFRQSAIQSNDAELARLASLAATAYEEAAMWAVKAATATAPVDKPSSGL
jgi:hypothetical protein